MRIKFFNRKNTNTPFVQLDTKKCKACWKCIDNCANNVINKVDLPWHKHALLVEPSACTGCLNCIEVCKNGAFTPVSKTIKNAEKRKSRIFNSFLVNNLLLFLGLFMIFSGLVLQLGFHIGNHDQNHFAANEANFKSMQYEQAREIDTNKIVCGFNYPSWSTIHKYVIVCFSLLMIYHLYAHWNWYKGVFTNHKISKHKQVIIFSVLFLLVAFTGLVPWFIDLLESRSILRIEFIEIHDKIALILVVFFILHLIKRAKWFTNTYKILRK